MQLVGEYHRAIMTIPIPKPAVACNRTWPRCGFHPPGWACVAPSAASRRSRLRKVSGRRQRISARFDEAVQMAEQAFIAELSRLVSHLTERLSGRTDGQKKIFRDSAITNLREFFDRFKTLNIHSSKELDGLVDTARKAIGDIDAQDVRDNEVLRKQVTTQLSSVQSVLDGMMVDQPRRRILRTGGKEVG